MSGGFHLAQLNVARLVAPFESPQIAGFRDNLDRINALAEASPGFIWRATGVGFDSDKPGGDIDPMIIPNMSLWESPEALAAFVYRSGHIEIFRQRHDWFEPTDQASFVLWWVPAGTLPQRLDAFARLDHLRAHGPTAHAFSFRARFPAPAPEDLTG
ncbi:DUF3291 domain-containing protein [Phenylobacterium sp.]|uniref:DUF3291 domain-containing protein n=1 Tax=Phenylobacterium sp. TaxID=1871053 RepID=UPI002DE53880|nr:DUF3291 domain-containing protein [Phenylobacterium sp.]